MKIFLITPVYATSTQGSCATPVIHYFAKEWVKQGHEVHVYNLQAKFPKCFYWFGKHFQTFLNTKLGMLVPTECPKDSNSKEEGVYVHNRTFKKNKPHSLLSQKVLEKAINSITEGCEKYGVPDVFIGHWHNPQLEVLSALKKIYNKRTVLVLHSNCFDLTDYYGKRVYELLENIDVLGFRNKSALQQFNRSGNCKKVTFIAYSGVSSAFIEAGKHFSPDFSVPVSSYSFVGSLIERKYPSSIINALIKSKSVLNNNIIYIGDGAERKRIEDISLSTPNNTVRFTGRIPRDRIAEELKSAQIFVMISKFEVFGLVYLEAMALGLIPIGSRHEGIDGIIVDGENGFLCDAGNETELASIFKRIQLMSPEELKQMSNKAKTTARSFTDSKVAERYLKDIMS